MEKGNGRIMMDRNQKKQEQEQRRRRARARAGAAVVGLGQQVMAEAVGTFMLIVIGCGAVMVDHVSGGQVGHMGISAMWGAAVAVAIYSVGHICGAHLNSAVTLASAALGRFPWRHVPLYVAAQVAASVAAALLLRGVLGDVAHVAATVPGPSVSVGQAFVAELIITFILMFVVSGSMCDHRAAPSFGGLIVGITVFATVAFAGPISGASLNPSRTIGSAVAGNEYRSIWIYMVAPTLGCLIGGFCYEVVKTHDPTNPSQTRPSLLFFISAKDQPQPQTQADAADAQVEVEVDVHDSTLVPCNC